MPVAEDEMQARIRRQILETAGLSDLEARVVKRLRLPKSLIQEEIKRLEQERLIACVNETWTLVERELLDKTYDLVSDLEEDRVWTLDVAPLLSFLPENVLNIWNFAFTEMLNNAIDHSEGNLVAVRVLVDAHAVEITLHDDGVGIFAKIQRALGLADERQAVLELVKGKYTTDRTRHSGLGIFYSARMMDTFDLLSGPVYLRHDAGNEGEWLMEDDERTIGTALYMRLARTSNLTTTSIFERFSAGRSLGFTKTVIPIALAQYGGEQLVSRSQAKRVLARGEQFSEIILNFRGVDLVGQGFADETFRVFANSHPAVKLTAIHMQQPVAEMVRAVQREAKRQSTADRRATPIRLRNQSGR